MIHNPALREFIRPDYSAADLARLKALLDDNGTFAFMPMPTGLYPAADLAPEVGKQTGYGNVWVRDNIHVAHALEVSGRADLADRVVLALAKFYGDHRAKFFDIVNGGVSHHVPMRRPHIRFDGARLIESAEKWPHAQNDALGLFVWFYVRRALAGAFAPDKAMLEMFARYFEAIAYWQDADSGHWEERAKIEASSIGCIVAALRLMRRIFTDGRLDRMLESGERALAEILPWECLGPGKLLARRYDSALLFLVWPLDVVTPEMAQRICDDVVENLAGEHGVRRYLGDSYWTADYKDKLADNLWTGDFSLSQSERDRLAKPGEEAQWCLFDPVLSLAYGKLGDRERQVAHFNRALGQITPAFQCPEAYYLQNGRYVPNDHTPLLWTQANLLAAFAAMKQTGIASQVG